MHINKLHFYELSPKYGIIFYIEYTFQNVLKEYLKLIEFGYQIKTITFAVSSAKNKRRKNKLFILNKKTQ